MYKHNYFITVFCYFRDIFVKLLLGFLKKIFYFRIESKHIYKKIVKLLKTALNEFLYIYDIHVY